MCIYVYVYLTPLGARPGPPGPIFLIEYQAVVRFKPCLDKLYSTKYKTPYNSPYRYIVYNYYISKRR
jgi:hypothetical protein